MFRVRNLFFVSAVITAPLFCASTAHAGPLFDWLFHRNRCCTTALAPPVASCGTCQTTCQQTCTRVVVNYVPQTAYRCEWERIPVTTYQQTSSTDPCTGCTVTCNRPCTTYTWQMKQVPYTTYRPVYTQQTYQVPVTYTSQVAMPVASAGCSTCAGFTPTVNAAPVYTAPAGTIQAPVGTATQYYQAAPATGGTIYQPTQVIGSGTTEADLRPSLDVNPQQMNRPIIIEGPTSGSINNGTYWPTKIPTQPATVPISPLQDPNPDARWNEDAAPQLLNPFNQTTSVPSIQQWNYSPVRLASHKAPVPSSSSAFAASSSDLFATSSDSDVPVALRTRTNEYIGSFSPDESRPSVAPVAAPRPRVNEGWRRD